MPPGTTPPRPGAEGSALRRLLLALVAFTALGLTVELVLLEHVESLSQWVPFGVLAAGLVSVAVVARRPTPRALRAFQVVMGLCIAAGLLGVILHYRGNVEFELERDPSARGLDLLWRSLTGATPALAPGALAQLGLLGLAYTYRHPALRRAGEREPRPR
jgi:hypothetical protein